MRELIRTAKESSFRGRNDVEISAVEGTFSPVTEPTAVLVRRTAEINDEAHNTEPNDSDDLQKGEPEFEFTKVPTDQIISTAIVEMNGRTHLTPARLIRMMPTNMTVT